MSDSTDKKADEAKRDRIDIIVDLALGAIVTTLGVIAVLFACSLF